MSAYSQPTEEEHLHNANDTVEKADEAYRSGRRLEFLKLFSKLKEHEIPDYFFPRVCDLLSYKNAQVRRTARNILSAHGYPVKSLK